MQSDGSEGSDYTLENYVQMVVEYLDDFLEQDPLAALKLAEEYVGSEEPLVMEMRALIEALPVQEHDDVEVLIAIAGAGGDSGEWFIIPTTAPYWKGDWEVCREVAERFADGGPEVAHAAIYSRRPGDGMPAWDEEE